MSTISLSNENGIVIENNYGTIEISKDKDNGIWIYQPDIDDTERYIEFSLQDAKWIVENLQKVIEEFEKEPVEVPFEIGDIVVLSSNDEYGEEITYHKIIEGDNKGEVKLLDFPLVDGDLSSSMTPEDFVRHWNRYNVKIKHVFTEKSKA